MAEHNLTSYVEAMLADMVESDASDMYLTVQCPPYLRVGEELKPFESPPLRKDDIEHLLSAMLTPKQLTEFHEKLELNIAFNWKSSSRFRLNCFYQQFNPGIVIRRVRTDLPTLEKLRLPALYAELSILKQGLVLLASPSGSGKSTSLAAMLNHRNEHGAGHILTIEDPIEYVHPHKKCIITQREVGMDTYSFHSALRNALRQRADVVAIGEIRDRETMEHAINFAETGHLCIATLHSTNTCQAIERAISFFPEELHNHMRFSLSQNLKAIISQRLVENMEHKRSLATEILLNEGLIRTLIQDGATHDIKELMVRQKFNGTHTLDDSLLDLYRKGLIKAEVALAESDNPTNLKLRLKQQLAEHHPLTLGGPDGEELTLQQDEPTPEV